MSAFFVFAGDKVTTSLDALKQVSDRDPDRADSKLKLRHKKRREIAQEGILRYDFGW